MSVFAVLTVVLQAALSRAFVYGLFADTLVHAVFFLAFFLLYVLFAKNTLRDRFTAKGMKILLGVYCASFLLLMIGLIGFQKFIPALAVGIVYVAVPFWFVFSKKETKKSIACLTAAIFVLFGMTIPGYFYRLFEISVRERTQELYLSADNGYFVQGVAVEKLYVYTQEPKTTAEVLFHNSLQAYTSMRFSDQILYESDLNNSKEYTAQHLSCIEKYYPNVVQQKVNTQDELLEIYGSRIENYILFDENDKESTLVAANLCHQKNAVMLGKSMLEVAVRYGWKQVFDATGWTEDAFLSSEYFDKLDRHLLILLDAFSENFTGYSEDVYMSQLWDLGIMNNAWIAENDVSIVELEDHLKKMPRNSVCIGSVGEHAENAFVQACARYATTFIYTRYTANLSVLSGFRLQNATVDSDVLTDGEVQKRTTVYSDDATPKHTVCVMLSDADNVRFCTESIMSSHYYQSPLRDETLQYNLGLAGSMVEIAPIFLLECYDRMTVTDDFCYQLSSIGYTYPSKWTDTEAWEQVTKTLAALMHETKTHVLEIMDDSAFLGVVDVPSDFGALQEYFDTYTVYDDVDGCLFIDYTALYAGYRGAVCWSNDKPVVSAKYSVWYDEGTPFNSEKNTIDCIVREINEMSTDKTSTDAYTFIIVHGWSGLDENGNLVRLNLSSVDVDNTAIFAALRDGFDEDVEMVSVTEFINRMRRNVIR